MNFQSFNRELDKLIAENTSAYPDISPYLDENQLIAFANDVLRNHNVVNMETMKRTFESGNVTDTSMYGPIGKYLHSYKKIQEPDYLQSLILYPNITDVKLLTPTLQAKIHLRGEGSAHNISHIGGVVREGGHIDSFGSPKQTKHIIYSTHLRMEPKTGTFFIADPIQCKSIWEIERISDEHKPHYMK